MSFVPFQTHDEEPTGLIGNLRDVRLPEIVRLLATSGKTAVIDVVLRGGEAGSLIVEAGEVLYAELGSQSGDDAAFELLAQCSGVFRAYVSCASDWSDATDVGVEASTQREQDPNPIPRQPFVGFFNEAGVDPLENGETTNHEQWDLNVDDVLDVLDESPTPSDLTVVERRHQG